MSGKVCIFVGSLTDKGVFFSMIVRVGEGADIREKNEVERKGQERGVNGRKD